MGALLLLRLIFQSRSFAPQDSECISGSLHTHFLPREELLLAWAESVIRQTSGANAVPAAVPGVPCDFAMASDWTISGQQLSADAMRYSQWFNAAPRLRSTWDRPRMPSACRSLAARLKMRWC